MVATKSTNEPEHTLEANPQVIAAQRVVAVVVTGDPGPELESCLRSLVTQDHAVSILVIDDASAIDPTPRIASVAPSAYVRRLDSVVGWAAAANVSLDLVEGADWLLICHDDVAPAPDAVSELIAGALMAGADIVAPKLVSWDNHDRLLSIGFDSDGTARLVPTIEPGDLDQAQHDFMRPVTVASSACFLIAAERFRSIGGFTAAMTRPREHPPAKVAALAQTVAGPENGEDLDLSWRVLSAGGLVQAVPAARVAHAQNFHRIQDVAHEPTVQAVRSLVARRNQVLTVFSTRTGFGLISSLLALMFERMFERLVLRRRDLPMAAVAKAVQPSGVSLLRSRRRVVQRARARGKGATAWESMLVSTGHRFSQTVKTDLAQDSARALSLAGGTVAAGFRRGPLRIASGVCFILLAAYLVGSRHYITGGVPIFGQFTPDVSIPDLLRSFGTDSRPAGIGSSGPASPTLFLLAIGRILTFGQGGALRLLSTIGLIPLGALGAGRLASLVVQLVAERERSDAQTDAQTAGRAMELRSDVQIAGRAVGHQAALLAGLVAAVIYGVSPIGIGALRSGSWEVLATTAALPWVLHVLLRRRTPQDAQTAGRATGRRTVLDSALRVGVPLAVVVSFAPVLLIILVVSVIGLLVGSVVSGGTFDRRRLIRRCLSSTIVSVLLLGPWLVQLVRSPRLISGRGPISGPVLVSDLLRLATNIERSTRFGVGGYLSAGLVAAAFIAMLLLTGERLRFAIRFWIMALPSLAGAWAIGRFATSIALPSQESLLVPAALGWSIVIALGVSGFSAELRSVQFGWRQIAAGLAALGISAACLPILLDSKSGSWNAPTSDHITNLSWIDENSVDGDSRVLWIGTTRTLPLDGFAFRRPNRSIAVASGSPGTRLRFATSYGSRPDIRLGFAGVSRGQTRVASSVITNVWAGSTNRSGRPLADLAIRYIVLLNVDAPGKHRATDALPDSLTSAFSLQLDLKQVTSDAGVQVYENSSWLPSGGLADGSFGIDAQYAYRSSPLSLAGKWLHLAMWVAALAGFLTDFRRRRRHLDQLVVEYDDVLSAEHGARHETVGTDDYVESALSMNRAFRSDDEAAEDFELVGTARQSRLPRTRSVTDSQDTNDQDANEQDEPNGDTL